MRQFLENLDKIEKKIELIQDLQAISFDLDTQGSFLRLVSRRSNPRPVCNLTDGTYADDPWNLVCRLNQAIRPVIENEIAVLTDQVQEIGKNIRWPY